MSHFIGNGVTHFYFFLILFNCTPVKNNTLTIILNNEIQYNNSNKNEENYIGSTIDSVLAQIFTRKMDHHR